MPFSHPSLSRRAALMGMAGASVLGAVPALAKDKAPTSLTIGSPGDGLTHADTLLTRYGKVAVPANGRILPFFQVELVEEAGERVEDRKYHANATADSTFVIEGIPQPEVQAAVDRLHAQFLADLQAAGYVIITPQEAEASEHWRKLKAGMKPSPYQTETGQRGKSTFYGPSGQGIYFASGDQRLFTGGVLSGFAGVGNAMSQATDEFYAPGELQGAMLGVELAVGFVNIKGEGGGKFSNIFGDGQASVKGNAMMTIIPERSRLWFIPHPGSDKGRQELLLTKTVVPAINPISGTTDITSRGAKLGDAAGTMIGMFTGTGGSYSTKTYRIDIDPAAFPGALEGTLSGISSAMVKRLTGLPTAPAGKKR